MKTLDELLNKVTMYRLVVYALAGYAGLALVLALMGKLYITPTAMIMSLAILLGSAFTTDRILRWMFRVPTNSESWLITSLILFLILQPGSSLQALLALGLAGGFSSVSKFVLALKAKHIFNPAAAAAALVGLLSLQPTTWWIGSSIFWPFTLLIGLAIVRKIRRFPLFLTFATTSIVLQLIVFIHQHQSLGVGMKGALIASPLIFLSTIMLTEPATMPPRRGQQVIFGALVAVLYVMAWKVGPLYIYPEVALLFGNLYAYAVSPKFRIGLRLKEIQRISDYVYNYVFQPDRQFTFRPGQYMEWTLAGVPFDSRGNRRTFTVASSPTEKDVQLGLKFYEPASAFKATLAQMQVGDSLFASQLAGNFTFNPKGRKKLVFIAGGIGITPFRSMVKYLLDNNIKRDIILLYVVSSPDELAYKQLFLEARSVGVRLVPVISKPGLENVQGVINGPLNEELLRRILPDAVDRTFYISGPNGMVDATKKYLQNLDVPRRRIRTDHFSGY